MEAKLYLKSRDKTDTGDMYTFLVEGSPCQYDKAKSIKLIQQYRPSERNCQTDGKRISLKAGYGTLKVRDNTTDIKAVGNLYRGNEEKKLAGVQLFIGDKYERLCTIYENDDYFSTVVQNTGFLKQNAKYLRLIDRAEIIDYSLLTIRTPYGVTSIENLSTGLKTLLNILYLKTLTSKRVLVNINECGDNILPHIFEAVSNTNICLCLNHSIIKFPSGYTVYVNKKLIHSIDGIYEALNAQ